MEPGPQTEPRIPADRLERMLDDHADGEAVEMIDDPVSRRSDEEHQRAVAAWAQRQIESGAVTVGGVRVYDDGSVVHHDTLQQITGQRDWRTDFVTADRGRPHQSKRGDENASHPPAGAGQIGKLIQAIELHAPSGTTIHTIDEARTLTIRVEIPKR